jgi:CPA2 family monovalent cation:H+ antiporter-2
MSLLTSQPRVADVTAIDYCLFLTLEKDDFQGFVSRQPGLRARLNEVVAARTEMNRRQQAESDASV